MKTQDEAYIAPVTEVVYLRLEKFLCSSGDSEGAGVNDYEYDPSNPLSW